MCVSVFVPWPLKGQQTLSDAIIKTKRSAVLEKEIKSPLFRPAVTEVSTNMNTLRSFL